MYNNLEKKKRRHYIFQISDLVSTKFISLLIIFEAWRTPPSDGHTMTFNFHLLLLSTEVKLLNEKDIYGTNHILNSHLFKSWCGHIKVAETSLEFAPFGDLHITLLPSAVQPWSDAEKHKLPIVEFNGQEQAFLSPKKRWSFGAFSRSESSQISTSWLISSGGSNAWQAMCLLRAENTEKERELKILQQLN